jgi:hypothetical protein
VARQQRQQSWRGHQAHQAPVLGPISFEYSAFAVDGRPDLSMVVHNPATPADADKISSLIGSKPALERASL